MFNALQKENLNHEVEKLKMIVAISRRLKERFSEKDTLTEHDQTAIKGYCEHIEKLAMEDEVDLERMKQAIEVIDEEVDKIEAEIESLGLGQK